MFVLIFAWYNNSIYNIGYTFLDWVFTLECWLQWEEFCVIGRHLCTLPLSPNIGKNVFSYRTFNPSLTIVLALAYTKISDFLNHIVFFWRPMLLPNPLNIVIYVFILKVCVLVNLYLCGREFNEKFLKFHTP